jgi:hypothetical protein
MAPRIASLVRDLSIRRIRPGSALSFPLTTSVQNPVCSSLVRSRNKPGISETAMFEPAPTSPSRGGENRATEPKGARATTPTLSVQVRRNCRWHSECQNGTPRLGGVGSFQPYETRLCDTFGQCQNGTKTMTQKAPLCPKSWHSFMAM